MNAKNATVGKITREQFEAAREISRTPVCPGNLSAADIKVITETVFISSDRQKADVLFVFGSDKGDRWEQVADLYKKGFAPIIYIAGGVGGRSFETGRPLSHLIRDDFLACGVPNEIIVVDERSTNSLEDAVFGKRLFSERRIAHQKILFACKAPHSGRCIRTLRKVFPDSELFPFIYHFEQEGKTITAENWWKDDLRRSHVLGEYRRIKVYSARGDIAS